MGAIHNVDLASASGTGHSYPAVAYRLPDVATYPNGSVHAEIAMHLITVQESFAFEQSTVEVKCTKPT